MEYVWIRDDISTGDVTVCRNDPRLADTSYRIEEFYNRDGNLVVTYYNEHGSARVSWIQVILED